MYTGLSVLGTRAVMVKWHIAPALRAIVQWGTLAGNAVRIQENKFRGRKNQLLGKHFPAQFREGQRRLPEEKPWMDTWWKKRALAWGNSFCKCWEAREYNLSNVEWKPTPPSPLLPLFLFLFFSFFSFRFGWGLWLVTKESGELSRATWLCKLWQGA